MAGNPGQRGGAGTRITASKAGHGPAAGTRTPEARYATAPPSRRASLEPPSLPDRRPHLRLALLLALPLGASSGCAARVRGLVHSDERGATVQESQGRTWRVSASGEGRIVAGLEGCEVELEGQRFGRRLQVRDWTVTSAPGGGQPFVGRLELFGSNWLIDDRSTGRKVIVDLSEHPDLAGHAGRIVLVVGYVVGAQTVRPVGWQLVAD